MLFRLTYELPFLAVDGDIPDFVAPLDIGNASIHFERVGSKVLDEWKCIAVCDHQPNEKVKSIFVSLNDGSLDPVKQWDEQFGRRDLELLGPPAYRDAVDKVQKAIDKLARQCVSLIQWRLGIIGSHRPLKGGDRLWWSLNGTDWKAVPGVAGAVAGCVFSTRKIDESAHADITALLRDGATEPLGHELLREAIQLRRNGGERSAFVVAVVAAEVGVKQCIVHLAPLPSSEYAAPASLSGRWTSFTSETCTCPLT